MIKKKKAALVCSGGGALGAAHIGMIKVFQEAGYDFDFFAGVSAGSIITSALATGKTIEEIVELLKVTGVFKAAFDFSSSNFGLLNGDRVYDILKEIFGAVLIEDLKTPLYIGTTDFSTGERVTISKGLLVDAVRASISVPVLFKPFCHKGEEKWLVDGGLAQNFPLDIAVNEYEGDKIFGCNLSRVDPDKYSFEELPEKSSMFDSLKETLGFSKNEEKKVQKIKKREYLLKSFQRTFHIIFQNQQGDFPEDSRVLRVAPELEDFSSWHVFSFDKIMKKGEEEARKVLKESGEL